MNAWRSTILLAIAGLTAPIVAHAEQTYACPAVASAGVRADMPTERLIPRSPGWRASVRQYDWTTPQSFGGASVNANTVDNSVPWSFDCSYSLPNRGEHSFG